MKKKYFLKQLLLLNFVLTVASIKINAGYYQIDTTNTDRETKIIEALKLFKPKSYENHAQGIWNFGGTKEMPVWEANRIINETLETEPKVLADNLPLAKKLVTEFLDKEIGNAWATEIVVKITSIWAKYYRNQPTLEQIQAIVGQEDGKAEELFTETPKHFTDFDVQSYNIAWYKYDWCWFGVDENGKVIFIKAICREVKGYPTKSDTTAVPNL